MNRTLPNYIVPPITPEYGGLKDRHEALRHYFVHLFLPSLSNYLNTAADIISTGTQGVGKDPYRTIASADTITISSYIHHISGVATINTINIPGLTSDSIKVGTSINFQAGVVLISDAGFSLGTADNIKAAQFVPMNTFAFLMYDGYNWYPLQNAAGGGGTGRMYFNEGLVGPKDSVNTIFTANQPLAVDGNGTPQGVLYWKTGKLVYVAGAPSYGQWTFAAPDQITMYPPPDAGDDLVFDPVVYA